MADYWTLFLDSWQGYLQYLVRDVTQPGPRSYFYWLVAISAGVYTLELLAPWRRNQPRIRKDFWLDGFYMFFNFFLFSLIGYAALSDVVVRAFQELLARFGIQNLVAIEVSGLPSWIQLLILFVLIRRLNF